MALAHQLLTIIFHVVRDGGVYRELGAGYHDRHNKPKATRKLVERLQKLGYYVTLQPVEPILEPATTVAAPPEVPEAATPWRRGRPCKCADRGIPCKHGGCDPANKSRTEF